MNDETDHPEGDWFPPYGWRGYCDNCEELLDDTTKPCTRCGETNKETIEQAP